MNDQSGGGITSNQMLRDEMKAGQIKQWEVAEYMEISEFTLSRWLRKELTAEQKVKVKRAIEQIMKQKERGDADE